MIKIIAALLMTTPLLFTCAGKSGTQSLQNAKVAAQSHFNSVVEPVFRVYCEACHKSAALGGIGAENIFDFNSMYGFLSSGGASNTTNGLIQKMFNISPWTHGGGNRCLSGITGSPCKEVVALWDVAFPGAAGPGSNDAMGSITSVSAFGLVYGWAGDADEPGLATTVHFFVDGPVNVGSSAGTVVANQSQSALPVSGNHGFSHTLDPSFRDGDPHQLYAYAEDINTGDLHALAGSPFNFTAFAPSAAGQAYFMSNVYVVPGGDGLSETCTSCHGSYHFYLSAYSLLGSPPPPTGTPSNNLLRQKAGGQSHGGGNICAGNQALCSNIQTWHTCEFTGVCP